MCSGCNEQSNKETDPEKPNIIYILADDLGYGELGAYGQEKIETPNIDALAENGMLFTQHYSGSPVCAPSRYMLLTGKHPGHAYIRANDEWTERGDVWDFEKASNNPELEGQRPIPAETITIGEVLQSAGYKTAFVGKWGLGAPGTEGIPNKQGFDYFFGYNGQRQAHTYYPLHLWENEEKVPLDNKLVEPNTKLEEGADPYDPQSYAKYQLSEYAPDLMIERTLKFIEKSENEPFFLEFATPIPHVPLQAPQKWIDYYREKFGDEEPYLGENRYFPARYPHATYAAMISYMDQQVGQIVSKLKEMGGYENTLIIFSSDNGPSSVGGADPQFFESATPFNSGKEWIKGYLHEGGIRVPMIASWPRVIEAGSRSDHISAFWDVMPTLAEVAGAELPPGRDGTSFLSTLKGDKGQDKHEYLYWEFPAYSGQQAVRMGKWKGIRENIFDGNMEIQLFNLEEDTLEVNDVSAQYPEIVDRMEQIMVKEHEKPALESMEMAPLGD
ncbi:arylsulfatase [Halalkalibaculum sp. DA384]|uniref:arylsulfatase n=1 Tax=Halalkalibaculum sp. DA384 TaxID=3373606 RepID=UPI003755358C